MGLNFQRKVDEFAKEVEEFDVASFIQAMATALGALKRIRGLSDNHTLFEAQDIADQALRELSF
jgi:hypothetical protein